MGKPAADIFALFTADAVPWLIRIRTICAVWVQLTRVTQMEKRSH